MISLRLLFFPRTTSVIKYQCLKLQVVAAAADTISPTCPMLKAIIPPINAKVLFFVVIIHTAIRVNAPCAMSNTPVPALPQSGAGNFKLRPPKVERPLSPNFPCNPYQSLAAAA